jgi:hypothetical protein
MVESVPCTSDGLLGENAPERAPFALGSDQGSPVSRDYFDAAPDAFNGTIGDNQDRVSAEIEIKRRRPPPPPGGGQVKRQIRDQGSLTNNRLQRTALARRR